MGKSASAVKDLLSDARFYQEPEAYPERLAAALRAAELRATTRMTKMEICAVLNLGSKASSRLFRDVEFLEQQ